MDKLLYTKQRAVFYAAKGLNATAISKALLKEELTYSPKSASLLLRRLGRGESIFRKPSTGRPSKATQQMKYIIEEQMQEDDETTAAELDCVLQREGIELSRSTILRCRRKLGWTYRGAAYCQLIREPNKLKRLSWYMENQHNHFSNVKWSDETTVQLENHCCFSHRKHGEKPRPKPKDVHRFLVV